MDNLGGLLFDAESSSTALANLREDGADLSGSDELHEAAKILCQAAEDDEQRKQLLTPDGNEVEPVFMELLLRSIRSPDVPTHTWGVRALAMATDAMNGMRSHTRRAIVGSLMDWLEPLVALAQNDSLAVQEWANEVLERIDIYSHREMRQQVQKNGLQSCVAWPRRLSEGRSEQHLLLWCPSWKSAVARRSTSCKTLAYTPFLASLRHPTIKRGHTLCSQSALCRPTLSRWFSPPQICLAKAVVRQSRTATIM